jgi:hypothetical protein
MAAGLAIFAWKTLVLGLPLIPSDPVGLWRVELEVNTRGVGSRGSVTAALPTTGPGQLVSDEHVMSDRMLFRTRVVDEQRIGVWTGLMRGVHHLIHGFRVQLAPVREPLDAATWTRPSREMRDAYGGETPGIPAHSPEIAEALASLRLPPSDEPIALLRTIFAFVADEIALIEGESDDALLTLAAREGSSAGKAKLLVSLLRGAGIPARVVWGLRLSEARDPVPEVWVEARAGERWVPMSPSAGFFASRPEDLLAVRVGNGELVSSTGIAALSWRYRSQRERLSPQELAALMQPPNPVLAALSLYRLPLATQRALRLLLVVPLAAFVMALMRNVIGITTFGTFLPVLVALALRGTDLLPGLVMIASVILIGVLSRFLLDRLHLLLVPRLCILLSLVVLTITLFAALGNEVQSRNLVGGILLPIVILAMLIERFAIASAEEGMREACVRMGWTTLAAVCIYPLFRSDVISSIFFGFPELVLSVMGVLVLMGGYTGYRLFELVRFRALAQMAGVPRS